MTGTAAQHKSAREVVKPPPFWPTDMMDEFAVIQAIRKILNYIVEEAETDSKVDIYSGDDLFVYMTHLQAMSGSSAELMGRMRYLLETKRGEAILAISSDKERLKGVSQGLQTKLVDAEIAVYSAAYDYCEYLNKRLSYAMDAARSMLSYVKEDMYRNRAIPQR